MMARWFGEEVAAVVAVADAELTELRAEVESAYADFAAMSNSHASLDHRAEMNRINWLLWRNRAEAAEAKVARVEALVEEAQYRNDASAHWTEIRTALDGDA